jgi:hypothetical protein
MRNIMRVLNLIFWLGVWLIISVTGNAFEKLDLASLDLTSLDLALHDISAQFGKLFGIGVICLIFGLPIDNRISRKVKTKASEYFTPD